MSREEAIEILKNLPYLATKSSVEDIERAICLAIRALEDIPKYRKEARRWKRKVLLADDKKALQKAYENGFTMGQLVADQEPCTDAVSRQWLMRKATERFYTTNYFNHITKMIEEAPSVNPQPCDDAISREAVIEWLENVTYEDISYAVGTELSFLPSVTQKPIECEDAISRDAVLEMAYDMSEIDGEHFDKPCMVVDVEDIQKLPPVTQKSVFEDIKADLTNEANEHMTEGNYDDGVRFGLMLAEQIVCMHLGKAQKSEHFIDGVHAIGYREGYKDAQKQKSGKWIPVSERLPEDLEPVNITWVNHEPEPYYHDIKDRNFVATGIYYGGQWYWYSTTCADYLGEYGSNEIDKVDDAVEIIAWMPLPKPYEPQEGANE